MHFSYVTLSLAVHIQTLLVGRVGLEPTTSSLKGSCSTIELPTRVNGETHLSKPYICLSIKMVARTGLEPATARVMSPAICQLIYLATENLTPAADSADALTGGTPGSLSHLSYRRVIAQRTYHGNLKPTPFAPTLDQRDGVEPSFGQPSGFTKTRSNATMQHHPVEYRHARYCHSSRPTSPL